MNGAQTSLFWGTEVFAEEVGTEYLSTMGLRRRDWDFNL
jgi:hypothetical protein